ncbi:MAG: hypothetical protein QOJ62_2974, partial [Actinomycetota bacterium]|nr:hypothetical protein [Actinomycetota bacterium]
MVPLYGATGRRVIRLAGEVFGWTTRRPGIRTVLDMSILTVPQTKCPPIAPKLIGFPVLPVALIALAKTVLHVAFSGRYGWHRDELYLFSMGRHLDAGSVDVAPLTPTVAHLVDLVAGPSLVALRATTAFAGALTVVVVALTARELGGRRYGQIGAALAAATCPLLLGTNGLFQPVSFDQLVWTVVLLLVVRLLRTRDAVWLIPLGGAVGVGIETKYTVLGLVAALVTVIAPSKRARTILRTRQVILAAAVALLVAAPNLWWQATHGWPSIAFFTGHNGEVRAEYPPSKYLLELCMLAGVAGLPLCIAGAVWLWRTT